MSTRTIGFVILVVTGFILFCEGKQCYECTTTLDAEYASLDTCNQTSTNLDCDGDTYDFNNNCTAGYRLVETYFEELYENGTKRFSTGSTTPDCFDSGVIPPQDTCVSLEGMNGLKYRFQMNANDFGKRKWTNSDTGEPEYVTDYDTVPIIGTVCFCQTTPCTEASPEATPTGSPEAPPEAMMTTSDSGACKQEVIYKLGLLFTAVAFVLFT